MKLLCDNTSTLICLKCGKYITDNTFNLEVTTSKLNFSKICKCANSDYYYFYNNDVSDTDYIMNIATLIHLGYPIKSFNTQHIVFDKVSGYKQLYNSEFISMAIEDRYSVKTNINACVDKYNELNRRGINILKITEVDDNIILSSANSLIDVLPWITYNIIPIISKIGLYNL